MANYKPSVLILEDDSSLGEALKQAFHRLDYPVYLTSRPDEVESILLKNRIDFFFSDCLLPQVSGVEFAAKMQSQFPNQKFKVIMMSGVYTDKMFIKEAVQKTKAIAFLQKPFELSDVVNLVKTDIDQKVNSSKATSSRRNLYLAFSRTNLSSREKRLLLERLDEISGYDLPFIYSLLAETKSTGHLNIYSNKGAVSGVSFSNGMIVAVDVEDKKTFLGEMLIQSGFINPIDLKVALSDKSSTLKLGQKLIQSNLLSPHAFDQILLEQMNIRLSYTVTDESYKISFSSAEVDLQKPYIDQESLMVFLHDLVVSKINTNWLSTVYTQWRDSLIQLNKNFKSNHEILSLPIFSSIDNFYQLITIEKTISQIVSHKTVNEQAILKAIHLLVVKGLIYFNEDKDEELSPNQRLSKISKEIESKTNMQIVEHFGGFLSGEFNSNALIDALTMLGPQPNITNLLEVWNHLKGKIENAFNDIQMNEKTNISTKVNIELAEQKIKAVQWADELKITISQSQYTKALKLIENIEKQNPKFSQIRIYKAWAKLGLIDPKNKDKTIKDVEFELMQVPPDEKYDYLYTFVMGFYYKAKGDLINAKKSFEKSIALDSNFIIARRELNLIRAEHKKVNQDIFTMDLKDVVSGFFKRKK